MSRVLYVAPILLPEHGQVFKQEEEAESNEEDGFDSEQEESDVDDDHNWSSEAGRC